MNKYKYLPKLLILKAPATVATITIRLIFSGQNIALPYFCIMKSILVHHSLKNIFILMLSDVSVSTSLQIEKLECLVFCLSTLKTPV